MKWYIVGSSPTVDDLPYDFVCGKNTICLNESFLHFLPNLPTAIHMSERRVYEWVMSNHPHVEPIIVTNQPLFPRDPDGPPVYYERIPKRPGALRDYAEARAMIYSAMQNDRARLYALSGTCYHTGIYLALMRGASEIVTVGIDDGTTGYCKAVASMKHLTQRLRKPDEIAETMEMQRRGNDWISEALADAGVELTKMMEGPCT